MMQYVELTYEAFQGKGVELGRSITGAVGDLQHQMQDHGPAARYAVASLGLSIAMAELLAPSTMTPDKVRAELAAWAERTAAHVAQMRGK